MVPVKEENGNEMSDGPLATTNSEESTEGDIQRHQLGARELSSKVPASNGSPLSDDVCVLCWQGYPDTLLRRFFWVLDMLLSLKGAGWNWGLQTPLIPTPRRFGPHDIRQHDKSLVHVAISSMLIALLLYIQMLLLQTIALTDPYFWGFVSSNLGSERRFGPAFLTQTYRVWR
ncbi:hypothetical protein MW887_006297 [Aspergillus wentii]|nr:hypothetical protein MW887_006297 [Aspergillus wentii]